MKNSMLLSLWAAVALIMYYVEIAVGEMAKESLDSIISRAWVLFLMGLYPIARAIESLNKTTKNEK